VRRLRWALRPDGRGGWRGEIMLPVSDRQWAIGCAESPSSKVSALGGALNAVDKALDNPVLRAVVPPQAQLAFQGVKALLGAARNKNVKRALRLATGPGARRLARALFG